MAANFWTSPQAKALVGREQLRQAHAADRQAGLSDRQLADLHAHFVAYMQQLARSMATDSEPLLRQRVVGTAAIYFRKFYLRAGSFAEADPRLIAPACLFLAAKTEETPVHSKLLLHYARRLCTKHGALPPPDLPQLVTAEAQLLEQLDGDLLVFSPYPSLSKFLQDSGLSASQKTCEAAWSILGDSYRTPLHMMHPPHIVALGALCLAGVITQLDLRAWLQGLDTNFARVHEVSAEMLSFYEHHASPISSAQAQQLLDQLGLPALQERYNVDCLDALPDGALVAGLSNFVGRCWTGGVAVIAPAASSADGGAAGGLRTLALLPVRTGIPAVACLPVADEFTGRRVVASGADDGSVDLWYVSASGAGTLNSTNSAGGAGGTGHQLLQHAGAKVMHDGAVLGLAACQAGASGSRGSNQLASASADGTLRLWDCSQLLASTAQLGQPGGPAVNAVAWAEGSASTLASASADGRLCLWDARQLGGSPAAAAAVGAPALSLAAAAGAGGGPQQLLVVGDQLGRVSVFDARSLSRPLQQHRLHSDAVHAMAAAPPAADGGGSLVASGSDDGSIMLLDCRQLEGSRQLAPARRDSEAPCYVRALAWGRQGGRQQGQAALFRGGWDQTVAEVPF